MAFPYSKILCPVDFDDNSAFALDRAAELARHFKASIVLVHVVPFVVQFGEVPILPELNEAQHAEAKARLADITARKLGGIEHHAVIYTGDIVGSILQAIDRHNPDLVVMATHGRTTLAHLILGSVAEPVVRKAMCPVLTVRSPHIEASGEKKS